MRFETISCFFLEVCRQIYGTIIGERFGWVHSWFYNPSAFLCVHRHENVPVHLRKHIQTCMHRLPQVRTCIICIHTNLHPHQQQPTNARKHFFCKNLFSFPNSKPSNESVSSIECDVISCMPICGARQSPQASHRISQQNARLQLGVESISHSKQT